MPEPLELSVVDDPGNAPQTFASEADRARLTPAPLIALRNLARVWKLTGAEAAALIGISEMTWDRIKANAWKRTLSQDQMMRVSAMIGIQRSPPPVRR